MSDCGWPTIGTANPAIVELTVLTVKETLVDIAEEDQSLQVESYLQEVISLDTVRHIKTVIMKYN